MKRTIQIEFGGTEYTVRPDFAVIERVEQRFDLYTFMRSVSSMHSKARDVAWVLYCALAEAGEDVTYRDIGDQVLTNIGEATNAAAEIVAGAIDGGPEKTPKKKSPTKTETPEGGEE